MVNCKPLKPFIRRPISTPSASDAARNMTHIFFVSELPVFVSDGINSVADYDSTPCSVVRRRRCRGWREGSN